MFEVNFDFFVNTFELVIWHFINELFLTYTLLVELKRYHEKQNDIFKPRFWTEFKSNNDGDTKPRSIENLINSWLTNLGRTTCTVFIQISVPAEPEY